MVCTLEALLRQKTLGLSLIVRGNPERLTDPIVWAHPCEYADPTPYLDGGELLMTTGLIMDENVEDERHRGYVHRLSQAGVCAVGFGVGVHHENVPRWLITQCEMADMPLVSIPVDTPFIAIEKTISRAVSSDRQRNIERLYRNQQRLLRSIHSLDPISAIVSRTSELIGGWVALLNVSGKVLESSHRFLPVAVDKLGEALSFGMSGEMKFAEMNGYDTALLPIIAANGELLGYLMAGVKGAKGTLVHTLVAGAGALLSLAMSRSADAQRILFRLRSVMVRRCLEGNHEAVRPYMLDLWGGIPVEPLSVIRVTGDREALEFAQKLFEPVHRSLAKSVNPAVFGSIDGDLWAVVPQSGVEEWMEQLVADTRLTVGVSSGCIWHDLARGRHEAYQAANRALVERRAFIRYGQDVDFGSLDEMIEPAAMRAFADLKLAPIAGMSFNCSTGPHADIASGGGEDCVFSAVTILRVWLECRCRNEAVSRRLGIHRHTVSKYVNAIMDRLGVDPEDAGALAELWYACRFARFESPLQWRQ